MKSVNNKVTITLSKWSDKSQFDDSLVIKGEKDTRTLRVGDFHGKVNFYMHGQKGFLILENLPKLRRDGNVLILDVGSGFYNVEFICFQVDEMKARMDELKKYLLDLYDKFNSLTESIKTKQSHGFKKSRPKTDKNEFNNIEIPDELVALQSQLNESKYTKTLNEYLNDLITLYDDHNIVKLVNEKLRFNPEFIDIIDAIKYLNNK